MDQGTLFKVCENEIIANLKHRSLTALEMAELIDDYLKDQIAKGVKLADIEKKLGVTKRVLYKYRSILKLPKEELEKYKDVLSFEQMSIITYSVKDKSKIPDILAETAREKIPSNKLVYRVAEHNNKGKIAKHIQGEIRETIGWAETLKPRISDLPLDDQKDIRDQLDDLIHILNGV